jgi:hypothetical protein
MFNGMPKIVKPLPHVLKRSPNGGRSSKNTHALMVHTSYPSGSISGKKANEKWVVSRLAYVTHRRGMP